MKIKFIHVVILFISIVSISCEKTVDNIKYPAHKPMLVIYSFISPSDTLLRVHVSTTKNIYGQLIDYPKLLPVTVTLIDNGQSIPFSSMDSSGYCYLKHSVDAGKQYKIMAHCSGYNDVFGECKIPDLEDINITIDTFTITTPSQWGAYTNTYANIKLRDVPNETNYYNISCVLNSYFEQGKNTPKYSYVLHVHKENDDYSQTDLISDHLIDGQLISVPFSYYGYYDEAIIGWEIEATVLLTDTEYYQYHKSLQTYRGSDEPFTEFSPVYTNIKGGLGIFCSYVQYKKTFTIK